MTEGDVDESSGGTVHANGPAGKGSDGSDGDDADPSTRPGPEREADAETHQDAGLDGGGAQAAQGEDDRVGDGD